MPPHRVDRSEGAREIRSCAPLVLAEVRLAGDRRSAIQAGFAILAGYIGGANDRGQRLAMTVPASQSATAGGAGAEGWTVAFVMPAGRGPEDLPVPRDPRIRLLARGPVRQVVERFAGLPETADLAARAAALRLWAEGQGLRIAAGPHYLFHDSPMTPPALRRNEVAFTLA